MTAHEVTRAVRRRALVIAAAVCVTFWNGVSGPFVFDDQNAVVDNPSIRHVFGPDGALFPPRDSPTAGRPVVNVSFAVNYALGALDVRGYHVGNIAIHLLCALLVFGIVRRTLDAPGVPISFRSVGVDLAFAVALIWALHPLNTEVVDYVTQRTESLMALCYLLTLYASIRAVRGGRATWSAIAVGSCAVGMCCKESMVTAPLTVAAYDSAFVFGSMATALRRRGRLYACLGASWLILAALLSSGPRVHSAGFSTDISPWTYLLNQPAMLARYLRLTVWPRSLVLNYGPPRSVTLLDALPAGALILVLLLVTIIGLMRRWPSAFLGLWCVLTLAPTSSIVPIATEVGAERRMYLPLAALVTLAVLGWFRCWTVPSRFRTDRSFMLGVLAVSLALAAESVVRNREYGSALSLAQTVLERRPSSAAHLMVGTELVAAGDRQEGERHLREAAREIPKARYALGVELIKDGESTHGIELLQAFVREQPLAAEALPARHLIGAAFAMQEQWPQAVAQFQQILTMAPGSVDAEGGLADALFGQHTYGSAVEHYQEYLKFRPRDGVALEKFGIALAAIGKVDGAVAMFRRAVEIDPRDAGRHRNLSIALLDRQDVDEAVRQAQEAIAISPENAAGHDVFGRALAVQGHFDDARTQFERALQINPRDPQARDDLSEIIRARRATLHPQSEMRNLK
jgi:tetratricopeptide (TPR) repeat protein